MWVPVAVWQPCELLYTCYLYLCSWATCSKQPRLVDCPVGVVNNLHRDRDDDDVSLTTWPTCRGEFFKSGVWDKVPERSNFWRYPSVLTKQSGIGGRKPPCQKAARFVLSFLYNTSLLLHHSIHAMPSLGDMKHKFTAWLPATDSYMQQYISALFIVRSRVQQVMSTKGGCMYHLGSTYYWRMYYCDVILFEWRQRRQQYF